MNYDFMLFFHDLISHPIMAILRALGLDKASRAVHNLTLPPSLSPMLIIEGDEYIVNNTEQTSTQVGLLFAELYEMTSGAVGIERNLDAEQEWTVRYQNDHTSEWSTASDDDLELALLIAIEDVGQEDLD